MSKSARKSSLPHVHEYTTRLPMLTGNKTTTSNTGIGLTRSSTFCGRRHSTHVPQPGREYDFRRSTHTWASSRKHIHGQTRPHVPAETHGYETIRSHMPSNHTPIDECLLDNIPENVVEQTPVMTSFDVPEYPEMTRRCSMPLPLSGTSNIRQTGKHARDHNGNTTTTTTTKTTTTPTDQRPTVIPHTVVIGKDTDVDLVTRHTSVARKSYQNDVYRYDVILSPDSDSETGYLTPITDSELDLTESVIRFFFQRQVNKAQRIAKWLADCEVNTCMTSLPAHLPDINAQRRDVEVSP